MHRAIALVNLNKRTVARHDGPIVSAKLETNPKMHLCICTAESESVKSHALQTLEESESKLRKPCNEVSQLNINFISL